jgi:hypothetical protein
MDPELLSATFVDLADTMVTDFDIIDFLHMLTDRSVALLAASAAGVVLPQPARRTAGRGRVQRGGRHGRAVLDRSADEPSDTQCPRQARETVRCRRVVVAAGPVLVWTRSQSWGASHRPSPPGRPSGQARRGERVGDPAGVIDPADDLLHGKSDMYCAAPASVAQAIRG